MMRQSRELSAVLDKARALLFDGDDDAILHFVEESIERFPRVAELRIVHASVLLSDDPSEAASEAAEAARLGSDDPVILVRAGQFLFSCGDLDGARSCASRVNQIAEPGFILHAGLVNLEGLIAVSDGEEKLAEEKFRLAVKEDPAHSSFAVDLVRFLAQQGRISDALAAIDGSLNVASEKGRLERMRYELKGRRSAAGS
jgi:tetratricopeptide (TPR) repeat protein